MGTTADKLNKVLQTKEAIRTAINNKGGTLTTSDKFSDYATAIDNIQSGGKEEETKSITITENGTTTVLPTSGKVLSKVDIVVNVPQTSTGILLKDFLTIRDCKALFNNNDKLTTDQLNNIISYSDTSSCTNMAYMFNCCLSLTTIPQLDTSNVTNMSSMFRACKQLRTIPQLDTSNVTDMAYMFQMYDGDYRVSGNDYITEVPFLDTSKVTTMYCTFYALRGITTIPQLDTSKVTTMYSMFQGCIKLTTIPQLDTSSCTNMSYMFSECNSLIAIPQFDTSNATNMSYMFYNCHKLTTIDLTHMKITSTSKSSGFAGYCYSLTKLIIRNMDAIPVLNSNAFQYCYHFYGTTNATYNPEGLKDGRIYVPDDKVESLKTATNWSVFADIIVPLSTLVEE